MSYTVPGPCKITFDSQDFGYTKAGVLIRPNVGWIPIDADVGGQSPLAFIYGGKSCIVECTIASDIAGTDWATAGTKFINELLNSAASAFGNIGGLASALGGTLTITERDGTTVWTAGKAIVQDPDLIMNSRTELGLPISFLIVPVAGVLFSTVPAYISG